MVFTVEDIYMAVYLFNEVLLIIRVGYFREAMTSASHSTFLGNVFTAAQERD